MIVFAVAILLAITVHVIGMAIAGVLLGATLREISVGTGPRLLGMKLRDGAELNVRGLPLGGFVTFWRSEDEGRPANAVCFDQLPGYKRAATQLAGALVLVLLSFLGDTRVFDAMSHFVYGALAPRTTGVAVLSDVATAARTLPANALFGSVCAALAGMNLLPLPSLNGGGAVLDLLNAPKKPREYAAVFGLILLLAAFVSWIVAFVTWL